jgi:RNA 2',3'-cyclic 3'-phosphodiesterase
LSDDEGQGHGEGERSARVRSFFALPLSDDARKALGRARDALARRAERSRVTVRFLSDEALHVTLCFLGYVDRARVPDFVRVLEENARGSPLTASFTGLGAFPAPKRARVVVAELGDPEGRLGALAESVSLHAEKLGIPREARAFRPHVTLARIKRPSDVRDWLLYATLEPVTVPFGEIRLCESLLHPTGSRYSVLARAEFRAGAPKASAAREDV